MKPVYQHIKTAGNMPEYTILDLHIDKGLDVCSHTHLCYNTVAPIPLYKYHEIPPFLKDNPYVMDGYRSLLPFSTCLKSMFCWNNETINIWSHVLGFLLFFCLMLWDIAFFLPRKDGSLADYIILSIGLMSFQFCMLCSAGYHLFRCHSEKASHRWLALDLTGISIGILGVYLPGVHYAFYCLSVWRDVYLVIISCLFGVVFYLQTSVTFLAENMFQKRVMLYVALVAYGVVPSMHWVYLNGGFGAEIVHMFLPKVGVMYLLAAMAFAFYVSKFPECCYPGKFDYTGASHQLWHALVVVMFYWWYRSGIALFLFRHENPCFQ